MKEREVTAKCICWLEAKGWRCLRMQSGRYRGRARSFVNVGEIGMADWLCIDYEEGTSPPEADEEYFTSDIRLRPSKFWLEIKAPGKQISPKQRVWIKAEEERGGTIIIADSLEVLEFQYRELFG